MECTLKKSNSNAEPNNRDHFMRHSVRFANIEMLRGSLPKSVSLDFGLEKTFAL